MAQGKKDYSAEYWNRQAKFWLGFLVVFILLLWVFSPILLPFVLGMVVAYLLNPVVHLLGRARCSRLLATCIILGGFFLATAGGLALLLPAASAELLKLAKNLPQYISDLWDMTEHYREMLKRRIGYEDFEDLKSSIENSSGKLLGFSQDFLQQLVSSGQSLIGFISVLVVTPIVAFYMTIEWPDIIKKVDSLVPKQHQDTVHNLVSRIDERLSGFIRGQLLVAFLLGLYYAIAMKIAGLNFGLIIGLSAGILSVIPMVGSTVGLVTGVGVAYLQSQEWSYVGIIAAIFLIGQFVEGNFLTPKMVGDRVGLHPLWILFALMAGGTLFGFVGVLIAVPVAIVISVLLGFALKQYRQSSFYAPK